MTVAPIARLEAVLAAHAPVAPAVSGGVDSMVLGPDGFLYASFAPNSILTIDPATGQVDTFFATPVGSALYNVDVGRDGNVYATTTAEGGGVEIVRIATRDGQPVSVSQAYPSSGAGAIAVVKPV